MTSLALHKAQNGGPTRNELRYGHVPRLRDETKAAVQKRLLGIPERLRRIHVQPLSGRSEHLAQLIARQVIPRPRAAFRQHAL
jgi:hypothetical protein